MKLPETAQSGSILLDRNPFHLILIYLDVFTIYQYINLLHHFSVINMNQTGPLDKSQRIEIDLTNETENKPSNCDCTNISKDIPKKGTNASKEDPAKPTTTISVGRRKSAFKVEEVISLCPNKTGSVSCSGCTFEERGDDVLLKCHCGSPPVVMLKRRKASAVDHWNSSAYTLLYTLMLRIS